jgi:hypothetical protein
MQVMDIGGANATATISNFTGGDTVLGDQGTYFMTDGNQLLNINEASGNELWRWQPNSGTVEIIAATAGGGVAVRNIVGNQEDVVRLDSNGSPTYDTWGTVGGSAAYVVASKETYVGETQLSSDLWIGSSVGLGIAGLMGDPLIQAPGDWSFGAANGAGNKTGQSKSSGCGDDRNQLIKEYSNPSYLADLTPLCSDFTPSSNTNPSLHFTFSQLDISDTQNNPPSPDFPDWAILKSSLLNGLEVIQAAIRNSALQINSAYRTPLVNNSRSPQHPKERHIHGDAVDIQTSKNMSWQTLHNIARNAYPNACIEPQDSTGHIHIDWRPVTICRSDWLH